VLKVVKEKNEIECKLKTTKEVKGKIEEKLIKATSEKEKTEA